MSARLDGAVEELAGRCLGDPDRYGLHLALVVVQGGSVVREVYGPTAGPDTALVSWSMAKSVTHAAAGLALRDGLLCLNDPVLVFECLNLARISAGTRAAAKAEAAPELLESMT